MRAIPNTSSLFAKSARREPWEITAVCASCRTFSAARATLVTWVRSMNWENIWIKIRVCGELPLVMDTVIVCKHARSDAGH